jgi:hypothetical protein
MAETCHAAAERAFTLVKPPISAGGTPGKLDDLLLAIEVIGVPSMPASAAGWPLLRKYFEEIVGIHMQGP